MNCKNCRVKGCWSRGIPRGSQYYKKSIETVTPQPFYNLPKFRQSLYNNCNSSQKNLLDKFQNYSYVKTQENFLHYPLSNTPKSIIPLRQNDFENGTVRIRVPGIYVLMEDIIFNPNENNDFLPKHKDIISGLYPTNMKGPYHLGFFAAITVETDDVIIDMNGFSLLQSEKHNFQQRFYANIELANAPFITKQGPGNFQGGTPYKAAKNVLIYGRGFTSLNNKIIPKSKLGLSSHHGIHGNIANGVIIYNIHISDYEVAAIALNGTTLGILSDIYAIKTKKEIPVLSTYSQARFIRTFINVLKEKYPTLTFNGKTTVEICTSLENDLEDTYKQFKLTKTVPDNYFKNQNMGYDGNVYGIVLNVKGVVINNFFKERTKQMVGNENIHLDNINIDNVCSHPVEIVGINSNPTTEHAYGGKMQAGPIGDIFQITGLQKNEKYKGTSLSDAQLILIKAVLEKGFLPKGTTNITKEVLNWAENKSNLKTVLDKYYYVGGGDSMGHHMKGNIGLFISAGDNITGDNINITNIDNKGIDVGNSIFTPIIPVKQSKTGSNSSGILYTGSSSITLNSVNISNIMSTQGTKNKVDLIGTNKYININHKQIQ